MSNMAIPLEPAQPVEQPVKITDATNHLALVRNIWLRRLYQFYPMLLALYLFIDLMVLDPHPVFIDLVNFTSYAGVLLTFLFFLRLYDLLPETLDTVWNRGLLLDYTGQPVSVQDYARFIVEFDNLLNSRWSWVIGLLPFIVTRMLYFFGAPSASRSILDFLFGSMSWFMNGIVFWKLATIALTVTRLPHRFKLLTQPTHPDASGGLGPLGDLCFSNALVFLPPTLFFTLGIIVDSISLPQPYNDITAQFHSLDPYFGIAFRFMLLLLLFIEVVVFLVPLYDIHREMIRQRAQYRQELGLLARRMDQINRELLDPHQTFAPEDAKKRLDTLAWMRQVYNDNNNLPAWPFNQTVVVKFVSSQVVPLLTLTGLGKPIVDLIVGIVRSLNP